MFLLALFRILTKIKPEHKVSVGVLTVSDICAFLSFFLSFFSNHLELESTAIIAETDVL